MKKWIMVGTMACFLAPMAHAQSLKSILKGAVRDTVTGKAGEVIAGADPLAEDDQQKEFWDDAKYTPLVLDGYHLFRIGNSGASKFRYGVAGRPTCDGTVLLASLTNTPLTADTKEKCRQQEHWLQQHSGEAGHELPPGWPLWSEVVNQRERDFAQLPLHLYYRFPFMTSKEERPDGIVLHFGNAMPLVGIGEFESNPSRFDITLKGPDVVYEWETWTCATCSTRSRQRNDRGHVRVMATMNPEQRNTVMRGDRTMAWDTIFYTIQSVRQIAPIRGNRPHYEITLTVDKVVLGMDQGHNPPVNRLVF